MLLHYYNKYRIVDFDPDGEVLSGMYSRLANGFSGADAENICREEAMKWIRENTGFYEGNLSDAKWKLL